MTTPLGPAAVGIATITGRLLSYRHRAAFALEHVLHPIRLQQLGASVGDARAAQHMVFAGTGLSGVDDAADAFRHTYAAGLATARLMHHGMSADEAASMVREAGVANENDSQLTGQHYVEARAMDLHNNEIGIALGRTATGTSYDALTNSALAAIRNGDTWLIDPTTHVHRPTTTADIHLPQ